MDNGHSRAEIEAWLIDRIARKVPMDRRKIDPRQPFNSFGIDSVTAASLTGDMEEWMGRELSPTLMYDYPSINELGKHLAGGAGEYCSTWNEHGPRRTGDPSDSAEAGALRDQRFQKRLAAEGPNREPIAVIGLACRFPGGADTPEKFWRVLAEGVDTVTDVPASRWDVDAYDDSDPQSPGKMSTRFGAFLEEVRGFDAAFFGISPREAAAMDPQQRILLETSHEALERAGQPGDWLQGSDTGVFVGIGTHDYESLLMHPPYGGLGRCDPYTATGNVACVAVGRISYLLGLQGPNVSLDTACSSSLVAVHLACQSLRQRECDLALAGGVNLILSPVNSVNLAKLQALSPDGRCKAFDAKANGFVRGEGCGIVVLKRLSDAMARRRPHPRGRSAAPRSTRTAAAAASRCQTARPRSESSARRWSTPDWRPTT